MRVVVERGVVVTLLEEERGRVEIDGGIVSEESLANLREVRVA